VTLEAWLAFCALETVLCFTPGPAVLLVVSMALSQGFRTGLAASAGILTANTLYFALSAAGVAAALVASHELFLAIKWLGSIYLIWVGAVMLFGREGHAVAPTAGPRSFVRGFVVQGANPKALVFFVALLPQFVDPTAPVAAQVVILGVSSVVIEFAALGLYAFGAVHARRLVGAGFAGPLERVGGAFLIAAGARLAWVRSE
jgi:threonine/homoserine/homoserine lactone efflux protein